MPHVAPESFKSLMHFTSSQSYPTGSRRQRKKPEIESTEGDRGCSYFKTLPESRKCLRPAASKAEANGWATSEFRGDGSWTGVVFRLAHMIILWLAFRCTKGALDGQRHTNPYHALAIPTEGTRSLL